MMMFGERKKVVGFSGVMGVALAGRATPQCPHFSTTIRHHELHKFKEFEQK